MPTSSSAWTLAVPSTKTPRRPRRRGASTWSSDTETAQIVRPHDDLPAARRAWRALGIAQQIQLATEAAQTRGAELTRAFDNLVMVASGMKVSTNRRGAETVRAQPCIIFVVRRKWKAGVAARTAARARQTLPRQLLAWTDAPRAPGQRALVAIPTDVQPQTWFSGARTHGMSSVDVDDATAPGSSGTIGCAVRVERKSGPALSFMLSAMHVFSPDPAADVSATRTGLVLRQSPGGPVLGRTDASSGQIRADGALSFDVQLAAIDDLPLVRAALADLRLSPSDPYIRGPASFAELSTRIFEIVAPVNQPKAPQPHGPMRAVFRSFIEPAWSLDYRVRTANGTMWVAVHHRQLLQFAVLDLPGPLAGDSGSAIVTTHPDGGRTLAGLYIGGPPGGGFAYAIPAWHLTRLQDWVRKPAGATAIEPAGL